MNTLNSMLHAITEYNLQDFLKRVWNSIHPCHKKSFFAIYTALNVVFLFLMMQNIPGREDWAEQIEKVSHIGYLYQGRYFSHIIPFFIFDGNMFLPVLNKTFAFALLAIAAIMLCTYWRIPKSTLIYSFAGCGLVLQPYILPWFYFNIVGNIFLTLPFFIIMGFFFAGKINQAGKWGKLFLYVAVFLCFWFPLGVYPPVIATVAVVFFGKLLIDILSGENNLPALVKKRVPIIVAITAALAIHFLIVSLLKARGIFVDSYNTVMLPIEEIPQRILPVIKTAFDYLADYNLPFFPRRFTLAWTGLLLAATVWIVVHEMRQPVPPVKHIIRIILKVFVFFLALFFSLVANLAAQIPEFYAPRIDFFGIAFFHIIILAILFHSQTKMIFKTIAIVGSVFIIWISVIEDFNAQKVWIMGFRAEETTWLRIIDRIETTPGFDSEKSYRLLILGATEAMRPLFFKEDENTIKGWEILEHPYMPSWYGTQIWNLDRYTGYVQKGRWVRIAQEEDAEYYKEIVWKVRDELLNADIFPNAHSVQIKDDIIIVALNRDALRVTQDLVTRDNGTK